MARNSDAQSVPTLRAGPDSGALGATLVDAGPTIDADVESAVLHAQISEAAYARALQRNMEPGHELEDWLAAERDVRAASPGRD